MEGFVTEPVRSELSYRSLWSSVVLQALEDIESQPTQSLDFADAVAFFTRAGSWAGWRSTIADFLDMHRDELEAIGRRRITERIAREGMPSEGQCRSFAISRQDTKKVSLQLLSMSGAVIGAVGQVVHETMRERQRERIAEAKRQSRYKRRLPTALRQSAEIVRLKQEGVTPMEIAGKLGIGRASVYRVLAGQNGTDRTAA